MKSNNLTDKQLNYILYLIEQIQLHREICKNSHGYPIELFVALESLDVIQEIISKDVAKTQDSKLRSLVKNWKRA